MRIPSAATKVALGHERRGRWTALARNPSAWRTPIVRRRSWTCAHHHHPESDDPDQQPEGEEALHQPEEALARRKVLFDGLPDRRRATSPAAKNLPCSSVTSSTWSALGAVEAWSLSWPASETSAVAAVALVITGNPNSPTPML